MDLSDAEVVRVISQGAQVYYEGKLMSVSDFTEPVEPQAIDNASCIADDYTSNSKNIRINITDNTYDSTTNNSAAAYFKAGYSDAIYWSGLFFFEGHLDNMDFTQMHVVAKNCKYKGQAIKYIKTPANYEEQVYYHCWDKNTFTKTYADVTIL